MKKIGFVLLILILSQNSFSQFKNIKLAEQDDKSFPPVDPSIAINKTDPNNIVVGVSLNRVISTQDGGKSWKEAQLQSPFGVFGNPAVLSNSKGNLFYFHLADPSGKGRSNDAWLDRIVCQMSIDNGASWTDGASIGNNPPADQYKAWPVAHPKKNSAYVTWTQFDTYGNTDPVCQSNILFSKSLNGNKWSTGKQINQLPGDCADDDNAAMGAVPAIGSDGKIYVTWANHGNIYFDRSYDDGNTWLENDLNLHKQNGGWNLNIPGLQKCNGLPVISIDNSEGKFKGTLYLLWADQTNGEDDTDIWLIRSRNRGDYWSAPQRINR
ncbi:MAG: sialidase family protein [Cyclobacteriaceae bacterium]